MTRCVFLILALTLVAGVARAAPPPAPMQSFKPHFVSQRGSEAYLREGPGYAYKIVWVYRHRGYPLKVTASFDIWRRVEDLDGTVGWMSAQMLTDARTVLVTGKGRIPIRKDADAGAKVVGLADSGAILGLKTCQGDVCRVSSQGIDGWLPKARLWGVDAGEVFK